MSSRYAHCMHLGFAWGDTAFDLIRPLEDESEAVYILRRGLASFVGATLRTLEGVSMSLFDTKSIIDYDYGVSAPLREVMAVRNYGTACKELLSLLEEGARFDFDFLLRLHARVAIGEVRHFGELRKGNVHIDGSVYVPPKADKLFGILNAGLEYLEDLDNFNHPAERAFAMFLFLSRTQAFENCNKRTASLAMNALLMSDGYIPVALDGDRRLFLNKMADFYERGDGTDMMRFLVDLMLRQQERYCDKLSSVSCPAVHAERDEDLDAETNFFASALRVFYRPK